MFTGNRIQPDIQPHEVPYVSAREERNRKVVEGSMERRPISPDGMVGEREADQRSDDGDEHSFFSESMELVEVKSVASEHTIDIYNAIVQGDSPEAGLSKGGRDGGDDVERVLKKHSTNHVLRDLRCLLILILITVAAVVAAAVASVTKNNEQSSFTAEFETSALHISLTSTEKMQKIFHAMEGMSLLTTTFVKQQEAGNNGTYPAGFVTIPDSDVLLENLRDRAGAVMVAYAPRIGTTDDLTLWNQYSQEHLSSQANQTSGVGSSLAAVTSGKEIVETKANASTVVEGASSSTAASTSTVPQIWRLEAYSDDEDPIEDDQWFCPSTEHSLPKIKYVEPKLEEYVNGTILTPLWSLVTVDGPDGSHIGSLLNWNAHSDPAVRRAMQIAKETNRAAFQDMACVNPVFATEGLSSSAVKTPREFENMAPPTDERYLVAVAPVFDTFSNNDESDSDIRQAVGYILAIIPWVNVFEAIHTKGETIKPVHIVVEDDCQGGDTALFTLHVEQNGSVVITGSGDVHEDVKDLNAMRFDTNMSASAFDEEVAMGMDRSCVKSSADGDSITYATSRYMVVMYPTVEYQESMESSKPIYYAATVLAIFIGAAMAFVAFDCAVSHRQRKLLLTARKQNALVSSLFPKNVHKQLMSDVVVEEKELNDGSKKAFHGTKQNGTSIGYRSGHSVDQDLNGRSYASGMSMSLGCSSLGTSSHYKSKPIADLFPETTIMYGDLVGFTEWSAVRDPSQVFVLLESIYTSFDALAKRRRVYKVEVVGDCYVAVCGLPDARKDHAVVMAKFAMSCLDKLDVTTQRLAADLGPETAELKLRVGLHSGPVVAGVLRGDRSRFQLFGATMNTANRMESTGLPNRVQVSHDTAMLLEAAGKGDWLQPRSSKVLAKGTGDMPTYFLSLSRSTSTSSGARTLMDGSVATLDIEEEY